MASVAPPCSWVNSSASHDDKATKLCVELQCLIMPTFVDTTHPNDLQPAQSESVCTVSVTSSAPNLNFLRDSLALWPCCMSHDSALVLPRGLRHGPRHLLSTEPQIAVPPSAAAAGVQRFQPLVTGLIWLFRH